MVVVGLSNSPWGSHWLVVTLCTSAHEMRCHRITIGFGLDPLAGIAGRTAEEHEAEHEHLVRLCQHFLVQVRRLSLMTDFASTILSAWFAQPERRIYPCHLACLNGREQYSALKDARPPQADRVGGLTFTEAPHSSPKYELFPHSGSILPSFGSRTLRNTHARAHGAPSDLQPPPADANFFTADLGGLGALRWEKHAEVHLVLWESHGHRGFGRLPNPNA